MTQHCRENIHGHPAPNIGTRRQRHVELCDQVPLLCCFCSLQPTGAFFAGCPANHSAFTSAAVRAADSSYCSPASELRPFRSCDSSSGPATAFVAWHAGQSSGEATAATLAVAITALFFLLLSSYYQLCQLSKSRQEMTAQEAFYQALMLQHQSSTGSVSQPAHQTS